jgi:hypothetical protein|tara:strand:+ start:1399 stop:1668 length:270 start_codon:yes stop_codon:yes gene_type:complete
MEIRPLSVEIVAPTTTGTASTVSAGINIRVINTTTAAHLVTLVTAQSGTVVGSFTIMSDEHVIINKKQTEVIFAANAGVKLTSLAVPRG